MEAAEEHGAVDEGLGVAPGDHEGLGGDLGQGDVYVHAVVHGWVIPQQADADPDDDAAAHQQNDHLEPGKPAHQRADAEEAGQGQADIEEDDDQCGEHGLPPGLGQGGVDDEQVLHPDGCDVGQTDAQALEIWRHNMIPPKKVFPSLSEPGIIISPAPEIDKDAEISYQVRRN